MAAPRQGLPVRLERAPHRGAAFALSNASKRARTRSIGSRSRGLLFIFRSSLLRLASASTASITRSATAAQTSASACRMRRLAADLHGAQSSCTYLLIRLLAAETIG